MRKHPANPTIRAAPRTAAWTALSLAAGFAALCIAVPCAPQPDTGNPSGSVIDPWKAYRARYNAIRTLTFFTTDTVTMLREALDPLEAPQSIYVEGKIDRPRQLSKANILLNFQTMQFGSQLKRSPETTHTLQRSMAIVNDNWIPYERDTPTTTTESPERLVLDMLFMPDPDLGWQPLGEAEMVEFVVDGQRRRATFRTYVSGDGKRSVSLSADGRAVRRLLVLGPAGHVQSDGEVLGFLSTREFGLLPRFVYFRQYDAKGEAYRELRGVIDADINEPEFDYLFE